MRAISTQPNRMTLPTSQSSSLLSPIGQKILFPNTSKKSNKLLEEKDKQIFEFEKEKQQT